MACTSCFEAQISCCNDIVIKAGHTPGASLYWIVRKANSNITYQGKLEADLDGQLTILKSQLPVGYLIKGENLRIELRDGNDYLIKVIFLFNGQPYDCVLAKLVNVNKAVGDESPTNVIQFLSGSSIGIGDSPPNPSDN